MNSGVYQIHQRSFSRTVYVGSSCRVAKRFKEHACQLRRETHFNPRLQFTWNKYGADDFEFLLVEECPIDRLTEREQHWFGVLKPTCNIAIAADSSMRGRKMSADGLRKMSESQRGRVFSEEHRRKISDAKRGKRRGPISEEHRRKLRVAFLGRKRGPTSDETKRKMSVAAKNRKGRRSGYTLSEETKSKMRAARHGRLLTKEHRRNIGLALRGRAVSNETRQKLSAANIAHYAARAGHQIGATR